MRDQFAALENPNDGCLTFKVSILSHSNMRLLVLFLGLLELYLVDLYTVLRMFEARVDCECVCFVDVFSFGMFC